MQERLNQLNARIANLIRIGSVSDVDTAKARVRVDIGRVKTNWLPWLTQRAGKTSTWSPLEVGEQVMVFSPSGELNQGVVIGGLWSKDNPAPSQSQAINCVKFADGSIISHDSEKNIISIQSQGDIAVQSAKAVKIKSAQTVSIESAKDVSIKAAMSVDIEAMTVNIKAGNLTISSPGVSMKTSGKDMIIDAASTVFTGNVAITGVVRAKNIA